jgi:DNA polymerase eta
VIGISLGFTGIEGVETGLKNIDTFFKAPTSKRASEDDADDQVKSMAPSELPKNISKDLSSFVCSRCGQRSSLPRSATRTEAERQAALALMQMEHEDFHLALDLSKVPGDSAQPVREGRSTDKPKSKKRRKESPQGIAKFFSTQNTGG